MKNYNSFINESTTIPKTINVEDLGYSMTKDAKRLWVDALDDLFLNKVIKFRGTKWSEKGHTWKDFVITVKDIDCKGKKPFDSELTIKDTDDNFYTLLGNMPVKIYDNMSDYEADSASQKYNI